MRTTLCLGLFATLSSCSPPAPDHPADGLTRDEVATVRGRAADATGPLAGVTVTVTREGAAFTTVVTDANGDFSFTVPGSSTWDQPPDYDGGFRFKYFVVALPTVAGVATSMKFTVQSAALELPALRRWKLEQQVQERATGDLALTVPGFEVTPPTSRFELPVRFTSVVGDASARTTTFVISAFDREDFAFPQASVTSEAQVAGFPSLFELHTQPIDLPRGTKVPLSRGAPCGGSGTCRLTDGDATRFSVGGRELVFTLTAPQKLARACFHQLVSGSSSGNTIELTGSSDGVTFVPLTTNHELDAYNTPSGVELDVNAPAVSQVRVRFADGSTNFFDSGSEVSFF